MEISSGRAHRVSEAAPPGPRRRRLPSAHAPLHRRRRECAARHYRWDAVNARLDRARANVVSDYRCERDAVRDDGRAASRAPTAAVAHGA
ncbi:hypothetical protein EVAR_33088_1 [Eumeta japonica]|uniref:Uncharacterized protein n=1 Tax=Eumeta variegata TaxID=151549 RepID=A0A4C1YD56_EUMVA|nr:hypothetical protein EVAR_33088_1 [Eumeta japonica]